MEREIKFRVWNTVIGGWAGTTPSTLFELILEDQSKLSLKALKEDFTFMQYTGLQDINGTEIYEGDIVKTSRNDGTPAQHKQIGTVIYTAPSFCINQHFYNEELQMDFNAFNSIEVIGNIYENKDHYD